MQDARAYIQSGNMLCHSRHRSKVGIQDAAVKADFDIPVQVVALSLKQLNAAVADCSFAADDDKFIHYFFLQQPAKSGCQSSLDKLKSDRE